MKVIGALLALLIITLSFQLIIGNKAKKGEAALLTLTGNTIIQNNTRCPATIDPITKIGTCTTAAVALSSSTELTLDGGGNTNNYQYIMKGSNRFATLTIQNYAVVTHEPLLVSDINADRITVNSSGAIKKVDITVDGDLTLFSNGKINVDGKGYPGGVLSGACDFNKYGGTGYGWTVGDVKQQGYGPGGGAGIQQDDDRGSRVVSGGGALGGNGGPPVNGDEYIPNSNAASKNSSSTLQYGSGGGAVFVGTDRSGIVYNNCSNPHTNGSAGGGAILLNIKKVLKSSNGGSMSANGANGVNILDNIWSGGGSGGWIKIVASGAEGAGTAGANVDPGIGNNGSLAGYGEYIFSSPPPSLYNVSAKGGNSYPIAGYNYGGGSGGRVEYVFIRVPSSVQKSLEPKMRNGVNNTTYNPYNLQKDDRIKVIIDISNDGSIPFTITDDLLQTRSQTPTYKCRPVSGTFSSILPDNQATDPLVWTNLPVSTTQLYYECIVS